MSQQTQCFPTLAAQGISLIEDRRDPPLLVEWGDIKALLVRVIAVQAQAGHAKLKVRGCAKAKAVFIFAVAAYNLVRIPKLLEETA